MTTKTVKQGVVNRRVTSLESSMSDRRDGHNFEIRSSQYGHIPTCSCGWPGRRDLLRYKDYDGAWHAWDRHTRSEA